jgi:hypothetical protein
MVAMELGKDAMDSMHLAQIAQNRLVWDELQITNTN